MVFPSEKDFLKLTTKGNLIPVYREILGDLETPVSVYSKLCAKARYSFLLESVEGEEKIARYSFIARDPELVLTSFGRKVTIQEKTVQGFTTREQNFQQSPLEIVRDIMRAFKFVPNANLPGFCGGLVGTIGYDTVRFFERLPNQPPDDLKLPDICLVLAKDLVIFDHRHHKILLISCVHVPQGSSVSQQKILYRRALKKIEQTFLDLKKPLPAESPRVPQFKLNVTSNLTEKNFLQNVSAGKKHIKAGDIIQIVLSQRFATPINVAPLELYRSLRILNPSPYMYYLNLAGTHLVGSSPELLVRCEKGIVETRPIAGTRKRGKTPKEDLALAKDLLDDPKEKAEHIMLVDLGRNDLGRVCERGSVKITDFMIVEKYSHVMHIVSNVQGKLRPDQDALNVLQACFPAGTLSGAPKIRAMEIIDNLETTKRGPYGGCIGYFSFSGDMDTCITIRTIVVHQGIAYTQAGAGIVADSVPKKEFQETLNKARAQLKAIELAHHIK